MGTTFYVITGVQFSNCEFRSDLLKTRISTAILTIKLALKSEISICIVFSVFESTKISSLRKKKISNHMPFKQYAQ